MAIQTSAARKDVIAALIYEANEWSALLGELKAMSATNVEVEHAFVLLQRRQVGLAG